jgi:hypothetical protein
MIDIVLVMGYVDQLIKYEEPVMDIIYEDNFIKISITERNSNNVFLCFSGAGMSIANIEIQKEEFAKSTKNSTSIFIVDKTRSWGNFDWDKLINVLYPYLKNKKIYSLGNSMGGFCAILASKYFNIFKVIAFVPQWSVNKLIVPFENRWNHYTDNIKNWQHLSLEGCFNDISEYHIIFGNQGEDVKHSKMFPKKNNIKMYFFDGDHYIVKLLKDNGSLYSIINDIVKEEKYEKIN